MKKLYDVAINFAYKGIKENDVPSEEYLNTRFEICRKYIALAGYRLADILKDIFSGKSNDKRAENMLKFSNAEQDYYD